MTAFFLCKKSIARLQELNDLALKPERIITADRLKETAVGVMSDGEALNPGPSIVPQDQTLELPFGWMVSLTYEQQPVGLCRHMSMSSPVAGKVPLPEVIDMVLAALGSELSGRRLAYLETFAPGHRAINIIEVVKNKLPQAKA